MPVPGDDSSEDRLHDFWIDPVEPVPEPAVSSAAQRQFCGRSAVDVSVRQSQRYGDAEAHVSGRVGPSLTDAVHPRRVRRTEGLAGPGKGGPARRLEVSHRDGGGVASPGNGRHPIGRIAPPMLSGRPASSMPLSGPGPGPFGGYRTPGPEGPRPQVPSPSAPITMVRCRAGLHTPARRLRRRRRISFSSGANRADRSRS